MTMNPRVLLLAFAALLSSPLQSQDTSPKTPRQPAGSTKSAAAAKPQESEGQRVFQQNCSRCHNAPEGFSPSISGTIVRHMRVRASLSQHDEQELLHFMNP
jgi:cytochrome c5